MTRKDPPYVENQSNSDIMVRYHTIKLKQVSISGRGKRDGYVDGDGDDDDDHDNDDDDCDGADEDGYGYGNDNDGDGDGNDDGDGDDDDDNNDYCDDDGDGDDNETDDDNDDGIDDEISLTKRICGDPEQLRHHGQVPLRQAETGEWWR